MEDGIKTKQGLLAEIEELKRKITVLESAGKGIKRSEGALLAERQRLFKLLDCLPVFAYLQAADYTIRFANKKFVSHYGEPAGKRCYEAIWGRTEPCENCPTVRVFETNKPEDWESAHPDGKVFQVYDYPFEDVDGSPLVLEISIDKTHCRKIEDERGAILAQLMQAQKTESIGTLAGGIAHDFNNIMTVIKMLTDLMIQKTGDHDPLLKYLNPIRDSSERAINLVQQLLLFSRNKPVKLLPLDLNEVASDLLRMIEHLICEDITIETHLLYDLWRMEADRGRLEQVIINLVINSSEAMPQGGKITLRTENITLDEQSSSSIPGGYPGKFVCFTVEDTGIGMDKEALKRIFEPFYTTKHTKSTGLGLTIVYGIIREHHGFINVTSGPGEGTVFKIYFPAADEEKEEESAKEAGTQRLKPGNGKRVLLVEDEKWVRKSTSMVLSENGYTVFEAANAENAISLFYREKGKFDIVLSDVVLPGRSGLQLVGPLLDINPSVPILLFSGHLDDKAQLDQIIKRGLAYIQKPYEISDLLRAIEETMARDA